MEAQGDKADVVRPVPSSSLGAQGGPVDLGHSIPSLPALSQTCSKGIPPFLHQQQAHFVHILGVPEFRSLKGLSRGLWDSVQRITGILGAPGSCQRRSPRD